MGGGGSSWHSRKRVTCGTSRGVPGLPSRGPPGEGRRGRARGWARRRSARVAEPPGQHLSCNRLPSAPSGPERRHAPSPARARTPTHSHTHGRPGPAHTHTRARARTSVRPRPGPRCPPPPPARPPPAGVCASPAGGGDVLGLRRIGFSGFDQLSRANPAPR